MVQYATCKNWYLSLQSKASPKPAKKIDALFDEEEEEEDLFSLGSAAKKPPAKKPPPTTTTKVCLMGGIYTETCHSR